MTDFAKHQAALRESQRHYLNLGTTPEQWHSLPVEEPPSYGIPWAPLMIGAGVVCLVFAALSI
jgi:hypothetical protein